MFLGLLQKVTKLTKSESLQVMAKLLIEYSVWIYSIIPDSGIIGIME
jgi:hypothetical protein